MSELIKLKDKAGNLTALIVEDSLTIQKQMKIFLEKLFEKVYVASDGSEGLELAKRVNPDIILTDLQMPKMDGHEFIKNLKEINNNSQIIVFSAYGHSENVIKFLRMGVSDFLQKPVNFSQLTTSLLKAVDNLNGIKNVEDEIFEDEILQDLKIIKDSKSSVHLINHYKGLPLIHNGFVTSVTKETISIQTQKIQTKAILLENSTTIETDKVVFKASLKSHDTQNNELILYNLEKIERSPRNREVLRITPSDSFNATIFSSTERYNIKISALSTKSISFSVKYYDEKLKVDDIVNLIMGFNTQYSTSYHNTITHKERVDCKAKVFKIIEENNRTKIVLLLDLNPANTKILEKYIYQREVEIIKEFKQLAHNL